jgi:hypothetical protein
MFKSYPIFKAGRLNLGQIMEAKKQSKSLMVAAFGLGFILAGITETAFSNTFIFNPRSLTWKAVDNGKVIRSGKASGGARYCRDVGRSCRTPTGSYSIISKGGPGCSSSRYPLGKGGAKMPYCMFFSKLYAVHGSYDVPNHNASHGCIRVHPEAARWLSHNFMRIGTRVVVQSY